MAVAAYFQTLRKESQTPQGKRMTQLWVAQRLSEYLGHGVHPSTIKRIESGERQPGGDILTALLDILHGRIEDVKALVRDGQGTQEDARKRALDALALVRNEPEFDSAYQKLKETPEGRRALIETAQRVLQS